MENEDTNWTKKPHRNQTSIAQEFIVSFTLIIFDVTIVYIGNNLNACVEIQISQVDITVSN